MYDEKYFKQCLNQINQSQPGKYDGPGVYCIKINEKIVYIGKSQQMDVRLANHICNIQKKSTEWKAHKYDVLREALSSNLTIGFDVLYKGQDFNFQEGVFIRQYLPSLNYQIPKEENWRKFNTNKKAKTITLQEIMGEIK